MSDKPTKKIDIYVDGIYVCSSIRYHTIKQAIEEFKKNPLWQGLKHDGTLGICRANYYYVSAWWSDL
jgi:hypothetical protein